MGNSLAATALTAGTAAGNAIAPVRTSEAGTDSPTASASGMAWITDAPDGGVSDIAATGSIAASAGSACSTGSAQGGAADASATDSGASPRSGTVASTGSTDETSGERASSGSLGRGAVDASATGTSSRARSRATTSAGVIVGSVICGAITCGAITCGVVNSALVAPDGSGADGGDSSVTNRASPVRAAGAPRSPLAKSGPSRVGSRVTSSASIFAMRRARDEFAGSRSKNGLRNAPTVTYDSCSTASDSSTTWWALDASSMTSVRAEMARRWVSMRESMLFFGDTFMTSRSCGGIRLVLVTRTRSFLSEETSEIAPVVRLTEAATSREGSW